MVPGPIGGGGSTINLTALLQTYYDSKGTKEAKKDIKTYADQIEDINKTLSGFTGAQLNQNASIKDNAKALLNLRREMEDTATGTSRLNTITNKAEFLQTELGKAWTMGAIDEEKAMSAHKKMIAKLKEMEKEQQKYKSNLLNMSLSFLFFGMALKRVSGSIITTGLNSFMKMTEGSTIAGQAITALSANWELLKFSMGEAIATVLLPLIPTLIDLIDYTAEFVQNWPNLTGGLVIAAGILGTTFVVAGTLFSFLSGISAAIEIYNYLKDTNKVLSEIGGTLDKAAPGATTFTDKLLSLRTLAGISIGIMAVYDTASADTIPSRLKSSLESAFAGYLLAPLIGATGPAGAILGLVLNIAAQVYLDETSAETTKKRMEAWKESLQKDLTITLPPLNVENEILKSKTKIDIDTKMKNNQLFIPGVQGYLDTFEKGPLNNRLAPTTTSSTSNVTNNTINNNQKIEIYSNSPQETKQQVQSILNNFDRNSTNYSIYLR